MSGKEVYKGGTEGVKTSKRREKTEKALELGRGANPPRHGGLELGGKGRRFCMTSLTGRKEGGGGGMVVGIRGGKDGSQY